MRWTRIRAIPRRRWWRVLGSGYRVGNLLPGGDSYHEYCSEETYVVVNGHLVNDTHLHLKILGITRLSGGDELRRTVTIWTRKGQGIGCQTIIHDDSGRFQQTHVGGSWGSRNINSGKQARSSTAKDGGPFYLEEPILCSET